MALCKQRFRMLVVLLTPILAGLLAVQTARAATPVPFIFFNMAPVANNNLLDQAGLLRATVVYDKWGMSCSSTSCTNIPSQSTFLSQVASSISTFGGSDYMIILDFENIEIDNAGSQAQANLEEATFMNFASWLHAAYPRSLIGIYDYDYNSNYASTRAEIYGSGGFTVFAPTLYQRWATHADWVNELQAAVANDRAISASLPIYPFISPYVSGAVSDGFLSSSEWSSELSTLISDTSGAIVWMQSSGAISPTAAWFTDLQAVLSPQIDTAKTYTIKAEHTGLCAAATGASDGSAIEQEACSTAPSGEWQFGLSSSGSYHATSVAAPSEYLTVSGSSLSNGAGVVLESSAGPSTSQTWRVVSAGTTYNPSGYYLLVDENSDHCLSESSSASTGIQLVVNPCSTSTTQMFDITPTN